MADHLQNSSVDCSGSSADEAHSCVVENAMWDEWTHDASTIRDEVSTSNFLPDLTPSCSSSRLTSFHGQADVLSSWMCTSFHPLAPEPSPAIDPTVFMTHDAGFMAQPTLPACPVEDGSPFPLTGPKASTPVASRHEMVHALGPQSPSSPLAIQNGMLNPLGDPWDGATSCPSTTSWPMASSQNYSPRGRIFLPDPMVARPRHTDIFIGPNGTVESTPGGWTPQFYDGTAETSTTTTMMASLREAGESSHRVMDSETRIMGGLRADQNAWLGKHRLELSVDGDDHHSALQLKRSKFSVGHGARSGLKWGDQGTYNCAAGSLASQAMDIIAIGPALNTNGKPRARRGSATDPQSVYARQRRERINDRLKTLQHLVPNGAKVDIVTMLDEAYDYVKFLQYQVTLLKSDEFWMHATPYNYNGMDISNLHSAQTQDLQSSA